jgi:hypothetical protein
LEAEEPEEPWSVRAVHRKGNTAQVIEVTGEEGKGVDTTGWERIGQWTGLDRIGAERTGVDGTGMDRSGPERSGEAKGKGAMRKKPTIVILLTEHEKENLKWLAMKSGMSMSALIRTWIANGGPTRSPTLHERIMKLKPIN